jgi:hypothetical protein
MDAGTSPSSAAACGSGRTSRRTGGVQGLQASTRCGTSGRDLHDAPTIAVRQLASVRSTSKRVVRRFVSVTWRRPWRRDIGHCVVGGLRDVTGQRCGGGLDRVSAGPRLLQVGPLDTHPPACHEVAASGASGLQLRCIRADLDGSDLVLVTARSFSMTPLTCHSTLAPVRQRCQ